MTSVWSKNPTGGVKSQPGTLRRSRNWLLTKILRSWHSGTRYHHLQKPVKTFHITKYLTFLQGITIEFVSNLCFVIAVLMILVIFGLHVARPRGCIAKWKLYSRRPLSRIQEFRVRLNKPCTQLNYKDTLTSCGISYEFKVTLLKYKGFSLTHWSSQVESSFRVEFSKQPLLMFLYHFIFNKQFEK